MNKSEKINTTDTKTYHILYETTNLINGMKYVGIHSTRNINDGYLGSGRWLLRAVKKYSKDAFHRIILGFYDNYDELVAAEAKFVDQAYVDRSDTYNLVLGGGKHGFMFGKTIVHDMLGKNISVDCNDNNLASGKFVGITKNEAPYKDHHGNIIHTSCNDSRIASGEIVGIMKGMTTVKDKDGNTMSVKKDDPRIISGELVGIQRGRACVKDKDGNRMTVDVDDPRYLSGELISINRGITRPLKRVKCPHCEKIGAPNLMSRYHFDNCKFRAT